MLLIEDRIAEIKMKKIWDTPYEKESTFQTKLIKTLKYIYGDKIWFSKISDRYISGIPDIVGCINGKFFALELKDNKGEPTELQKYTIGNINKAGGKACVVRTIKEAIEIITTI